MINHKHNCQHHSQPDWEPWRKNKIKPQLKKIKFCSRIEWCGKSTTNPNRWPPSKTTHNHNRLHHPQPDWESWRKTQVKLCEKKKKPHSAPNFGGAASICGWCSGGGMAWIFGTTVVANLNHLYLNCSLHSRFPFLPFFPSSNFPLLSFPLFCRSWKKKPCLRGRLYFCHVGKVWYPLWYNNQFLIIMKAKYKTNGKRLRLSISSYI